MPVRFNPSVKPSNRMSVPTGVATSKEMPAVSNNVVITTDTPIIPVPMDMGMPVTRANKSLSKSEKNHVQNGKSKGGHSKRLPVDFDLYGPGRCRLGHLLTLFQVSHAKFYADLKRKKIAPPDGNDGRPWWHNATVRKMLEG